MKELAPVIAIALLIFTYAGFLWLTSVTTGWRELARHYRVSEPPADVWLMVETMGGSPVHASPLAMNSVDTSESATKIGAGPAGLYLGQPLFLRPLQPTLLIPWKDVTDAWMDEVTPALPPGYVKLSFAATPSRFIYIDGPLARELKARSQGEWKPTAIWKIPRNFEEGLEAWKAAYKKAISGTSADQ